MSRPEITCERRGSAGVVVLERPAALNALTLGMVRGMVGALDAWEADPAVTRVVITAAGDKAFCAGGDIRLLYDQGRAGDHASQMQFWREEYGLDIRLKRFPKPTVALIDGIVMGGGVGVSVHARHRVAGDRYVFAMPEVGIGFFPDVGATYFLPRLPGQVGTLMALTGARVKSADALALGLATAYVPSSEMAALADALGDDRDVGEAIAAFANAPPPLPASILADTGWIDHCFAPDCLPTIRDRLKQAAAAGNQGAEAALKKLSVNSPTSMAIALRQTRIGGDLDFEAAMRTEFRIVARVCRGHDFYEGVRALIVDKDNRPQWQPKSLEDLSDNDVEPYFASLGEEELDTARAHAGVGVDP